MNKEEFLYPRQAYHGTFSPTHLLFDANLQEFSQRTCFIANLMSNGKMSPGEAYTCIHLLWERLSRSHQILGIETEST
ncbi:MAG: hypothetical protein OHK0012_18120 [Synechococcales cyanobacterium]